MKPRFITSLRYSPASDWTTSTVMNLAETRARAHMHLRPLCSATVGDSCIGLLFGRMPVMNMGWGWGYP